jgi:NAD(P)-dependent dehydrogenase (short-subunit alcohol dehydrogenase family)
VVNVSSTLGSLGDQSDTSSDFYGTNVLAYNSSKTALNMITQSFAKELSDTADKSERGLPRYVATDMNDHQGPRTVQQGATASVRYATCPMMAPAAASSMKTAPLLVSHSYCACDGRVWHAAPQPS